MLYRAFTTALLLATITALFFSSAVSQRRIERAFGVPAAGEENRSRRADATQFGEFTFARAVYDSPGSPYNWWFGGAWRVDYPEADEHFVTGISEWVGTNLNVSPRPVHLRLTDDRLFDYPMTYIVEPGHMELSEEEAARLREYLLRGGFLFLDDFHGDYEWGRVQQQFRRVFPSTLR